MTSEEFEEVFGDTPFWEMKKIKAFINKNYIRKDIIKDKIEQLESYYDTSKETTPTSTNQFIIDVVSILEEILNEEGEPDAK